MARGFELYKSTFFLAIIMGFGSILIIGLTSGFAGRTPNCSGINSKPETTAIPFTVPTTTKNNVIPTEPITTKSTLITSSTSSTSTKSSTTDSTTKTTLTSSVSTTKLSTTTITSTTTLPKYYVVLTSLATLSSISRGLLPGNKTDVSRLEALARNYFQTQYQAKSIFLTWTNILSNSFSMNVRFEISTNTPPTIDKVINDFINIGYNDIFAYEVIPNGYKSEKNSYETIIKKSYITASSITTEESSTKTTTRQILTTTRPLESDYRLPKTIEPFNYDLTLKAFFKPFGNQDDEYFEGTVKIGLNVLNKTNSIVLHADRSIQIQGDIKVTDELNNVFDTVANLSTNYDKNQFYKINLKNELVSGSKYYLEMSFYKKFGPLSNLVGFYRARYTEEDVPKTVLATQFEATFARQAFPCFDEPALKATYNIIIEHPDDSIALSNWPVIKQTPLNPNRLRTEFKITFKMSTYLAAWVIVPNDFNYNTKTTANGKEVRVYARKLAHKNGLLEFAAETARLVIDYFENDYFKISDALPPKIDLVGLPEFQAGAMEHWGVIGFRESRLFYKSEENSVIDKQTVALIVAHELAHFWFGNYATCSWWNDLWLNEAMASFLESKAIDAVYPEMNMMNQFVVNRLAPVMYDDGFDFSQTVAAGDVLTPEEISNLFSSFTYDKGGSILLMLESTVGADKFKEGLIKYLKKNAYGSGVGVDFYNSLDMPQELVDANVNGEEFVKDFIEQINYPLVNVELAYESGQTVVSFKQSRFLHSILKIDMANIPSSYNYTWKIYLQCKVGGTFDSNKPDDKNQHLVGSSEDFNFYLDTESNKYKLNSRQFSWIKCNKDFRGYYLTKYSNKNFEALEHVMQNSDVLSIGDRAHLLHTSFALSYAGIVSYQIPNQLSSYMEAKEYDYVPWRIYYWHLTKIASLLEHRASFKNIRGFSIQTAKGILGSSNFNDLWDGKGNHTDQLLKIYTVEFLCRFQDTLCLNKATELFKLVPANFFSNPNNQTNLLPPNYRAQVYKYHIQNTNDYFDWIELQVYYYKTVDPIESFNSLRGLSFHRSTWLLDGLLKELIQPGNSVKSQDFFDVISLVGDNPVGRYQAWMFVRRYYNLIVSKFGNSKGFAGSIKRICSSFDNVFLYEEMKQYFESTEPGAGFFIRQQTEDIVLNNLYWVGDREQDIVDYFSIPD